MFTAKSFRRAAPRSTVMIGVFSALFAFSCVMLGTMGSASAAKLTVLHAFCLDDYCTDGASPQGTPALDAAGNLYGTTEGTNDIYEGYPYGTVFKITAKGAFVRLHEFCSAVGCDDGIYPQSDITLDSKGNLYGVSSKGGTAEKGTVYRITPSGALTVLHSFCSHQVENTCVDGDQVNGSVIVDSAASVYGLATVGGNNGEGLLYKVTAANAFSVVYSFCSSSDCIDGSAPDGRLVADAAGNLYGVTYYGGAYGGGEVFKVSASTHKLTVLYSFCKLTGCADGDHPRGGLVFDKTGNLYGVTNYGGGNGGDGVLFKITPTNQFSVLRRFCALSFCTDGANPNGALAINSAGVIYGTTYYGGNESNGGILFRYDTVKKQYSLTYTFCTQTDCNDGDHPAVDAGVAIDKAGNLYGTTLYGGKSNQGVVYKITP
jgi:uncharacterized repeat protein (TIGR03803 family)